MRGDAEMEKRKAVTTATLRKMKTEGDKIAMITAYDYPSAKLADEAKGLLESAVKDARSGLTEETLKRIEEAANLL